MMTFFEFKNKIKFILCFFSLFFVFTMNADAVLASKWQGPNTYVLDGVTVSRPGDRWRVIDQPGENLISFVYQRRGDDVTIRVYPKEEIYTRVQKTRVHRHYWHDYLKNILLEDFEAQGFRFVEYLEKKNSIFAIGVNQDRDYLLLEFFFKGATKHKSDMIVVETVLDDKDYLKFRDDFAAVTGSLMLH